MIKVDLAAFRPIAKQIASFPVKKTPVLPEVLSRSSFISASRTEFIRKAAGDGDGPCGYSMDPCGAIP